MASVGD